MTRLSTRRGRPTPPTDITLAPQPITIVVFAFTSQQRAFFVLPTHGASIQAIVKYQSFRSRIKHYSRPATSSTFSGAPSPRQHWKKSNTSRQSDGSPKLCRAKQLLHPPQIQLQGWRLPHLRGWRMPYLRGWHPRRTPSRHWTRFSDSHECTNMLGETLIHTPS